MANLRMYCTQINLHHSVAATSNLSENIAKGNKHSSYIALIQEPYCKYGKVRGFSNKVTIIETCDVNNQPRAALLISKDMPVFKLANFCNRDIAAAIITINDRNVVVASVYMPHNNEEHPSTVFQNMVQYCEDHNYELIIGADANSHHEYWGCTESNSRGDSLVEFLSTKELHVINKGIIPTFVTRSRQEILDITMVSSGMLQTYQIGMLTSKTQCLIIKPYVL